MDWLFRWFGRGDGSSSLSCTSTTAATGQAVAGPFSGGHPKALHPTVLPGAFPGEHITRPQRRPDLAWLDMFVPAAPRPCVVFDRNLFNQGASPSLATSAQGRFSPKFKIPPSPGSHPSSFGPKHRSKATRERRSQTLPKHPRHPAERAEDARHLDGGSALGEEEAVLRPGRHDP